MLIYKILSLLKICILYVFPEREGLWKPNNGTLKSMIAVQYDVYFSCDTSQCFFVLEDPSSWSF